ncbi:MAG TPA: DNA-formamidopyrimidine glycosylase family protein [Flavisolibacter sp.]|nr:DNA-formamidopyrimidine glycosylase family protein [Flavisolibacter sp.]
MPEGPSLVIAKEEMQLFKGKKVLMVSGNSKIEKERMKDMKLVDIKTWGKHLLLCFNGFTIRIHFLMFGKYLVNATKDAVPRLSLKFKNGELNLYTCAVKMIEEPLDQVYDWKADVLNDEWDAKAAKKKLNAIPETLVTDALLDQNIFAGVGNIIKNEVLYRIKVHPKSKLGALPVKKLNELVKEARNYSFEFLKWKKEFTLKKHWLVHTKKTCARDDSKIIKEYLGKTNRRTFFCNTCQVLYNN